MQPLSNKMRARLFNGYGPISSLAAKSDIAYAFRCCPILITPIYKSSARYEMSLLMRRMFSALRNPALRRWYHG